MKVLITGANGLLGQKLAPLLESKGMEVIATSIGECRIYPAPDDFSYCPMDITQADEVSQTLAHYKPDVVINTAAMTQVDACESEREKSRRVNVEGVKHLIEACEVYNIFLLHLSTDFVFDGTQGPYAEEALPSPVNYYGQCKLDAEEALRRSGCRWSIARTCLVYGLAPRLNRSNIVLWVKESLAKKQTVRLVNDQWRTPTWAEDLAMGCGLIVQKETEGIFHLSGEDMLTPFDMAKQVADCFDLESSFITAADSLTFSQPAKRPPKTGFVLKKAEKVLGYQPHTFLEGLAHLKRQFALDDD